MNNTLREALLHATVQEQGSVIDWVRRPWAPANNDALRGAYHEALRNHGATRALAYALELEIRSLEGAERDLEHVASRLGLQARTCEAVGDEIVRRLGAAPKASAAAISPEVVALVLQVAAEVALRVLREGGRRHRHGRR